MVLAQLATVLFAGGLCRSEGRLPFANATDGSSGPTMEGILSWVKLPPPKYYPGGYGGGQYHGAAAVETTSGKKKVVFAPYDVEGIGVLNMPDYSFKVILKDQFDNKESLSLNLVIKYFGAAAVGNKVVFAPANSLKIGVFDAETETFKEISMENSGQDPNQTLKYSGATAWKNKVVFAPFNASNIGVFDVSTEGFKIKKIPHDPTYKGEDSGNDTTTTITFAFVGTANINETAYFGPCDSTGLGSYNIDTDAYEFISINDTVGTTFMCGTLEAGKQCSMAGKYYGVAASGTKVVFAPFHARGVGVYDTQTKKFKSYDVSADLQKQFGGGNHKHFKWYGATSWRGKVIFPPYNVFNYHKNVTGVGVFDVATEAFHVVKFTCKCWAMFSGIASFDSGIKELAAADDQKYAAPINTTYMGKEFAIGEFAFAPCDYTHLGIFKLYRNISADKEAAALAALAASAVVGGAAPVAVDTGAVLLALLALALV